MLPPNLPTGHKTVCTFCFIKADVIDVDNLIFKLYLCIPFNTKNTENKMKGSAAQHYLQANEGCPEVIMFQQS